MATLVGVDAGVGTVTDDMPEPQPAARQLHKANRRESTADNDVAPEWQRTGWDSGFTVAPASRIHQMRNGINKQNTLSPSFAILSSTQLTSGISTITRSRRPTGGPLKPGFGLSGDVHTSQTWANEGRHENANERPEDFVQWWNYPTQAKTGLEWATRRDTKGTAWSAIRDRGLFS